MKTEITEEGVSLAVFSLLQNKARKATVYRSEKQVVTATRRHKPDARSRTIEICVKLGAPNYRERQFIKACKKAHEPFPVRKVQLKFWPKK